MATLSGRASYTTSRGTTVGFRQQRTSKGFQHLEQILFSEQAGITVTLPKPLTSQAKFAGRFGKQDFVYIPDQNTYRCPAGETLTEVVPPSWTVWRLS